MKQINESNYRISKKKLNILENLQSILLVLSWWSFVYIFLRGLIWIILWIVYGESSDLIPNILSQFVPETSFLGLNKILHFVITDALGPFLFLGAIVLLTDTPIEKKIKKLREEIRD